MNAQKKHHVGCRSRTVADTVQGVHLPLSVLYPTRAAESIASFGPYSLSVAIDAPIVGEQLPLVVISHGNTGSPWTHRETAAHLARAGFVVALPEHLGNSRSDASLTGTIANLENRPRHIHLVRQALFGDATLEGHIARTGFAIIGHSIGAYTALAAAGGRPWAAAHESADGVPRPLDVVSDPLVRALVLLAPASPWFIPDGALAAVTQPMVMYTGELDALAPSFHADIILNGIADRRRIEHRIVPGAGHFSFQSPFPPAMTRPGFPPSQDPPGFDRAAFQLTLNPSIEAFLRKNLEPSSSPAPPERLELARSPSGAASE